MESVKKTKEYEIFKKRSGKFAVKGNDRKWINGLEKAKILVDAKLIKTGLPKEAPAEEAPAAAEAPATEEAAAE